MKRLVVAVVIFILIIMSCIFTTYQLNDRTQDVLEKIESCSELFEKEKYDDCYKSLIETENTWIKSETILSQLVSRDKVEEIGRSIALAKAYASAEDVAGFFSTIEDIKILISHLKKEEGFTI